MRVFITGGTGLVGGRLVQQLLAREHQPVVLTRNVERGRGQLPDAVEFVQGDPSTSGDWMSAVKDCSSVVNLVGESVFGRRWSDKQKQRLRDSRIHSTNNLVQAIADSEGAVRSLISASAIGYYGDVTDGDVTEESSHGEDFLARLCVDWEAAAQSAQQHGARVVIVRIGVVLDRDGGALKQMLPPFKLGLGGPVGNGRQWVSWIHLDDLIGIITTAVENEEFSGAINGTGPQPLRNKDFSKSLATALHRPCLFPVPGFMLKLMFGEVAYVLTTGQKVIPTRAKELGYNFKHSTCDEAMEEIFKA